MAGGGVKAIIASQYNDAGSKKAQADFAKLGKTIKGVLGAVGLSVGLKAIIGQLGDMAREAAKDQKSQQLLANTLRNVAGASDVALSSNEKFLQTLQRQVAIADDDLRPALGKLAAVTHDVTKAQGLLVLATNLAAYKGVDLSTASNAIAKAQSGQMIALNRLVPEIKGAANWTDALGKATKGAAETAAQNDPFQRMQVSMQDMQEQLGYILLPMLSNFADFLASADFAKSFSNLVVAIQSAGQSLDVLFKGISGKGAFQSLIDFLGATFIGLSEITFAAADAGKTFGYLFTGQWAKAGEQMGSFFTRYNNFVDGIYKKQEAAAKNVGVYKPMDFSGITGTITPGTTSKTGGVSTAATAAAKAVDDAAQAYLDAALAAQTIMDANAKLVSSFKDVFATKTELGAFEQAAVDAFGSIFDSIDSALADGAILSGAAEKLTTYARAEQAVLQGIARQRDILAGKLDVARTITSGVLGLVNITNLLETTSRSVTETVTSISNGISLATTKTFDVVSSGGLVDNFQKLVDKTKAFAKNLVDLKKLGLNKQLFAQLVQAGADAGGATAQALVDGGSDTISALNDLYGQLEMSAGDIAATATDTLYAVGQQIVSNGFIEGLLSQDSELQRAAQALAQAFADTFTGQLQLAVNAVLPDASALGGQVSGGGGGGGGLFNGRGLMQAASVGRGTVYNVNVSAGVVTDPNSLAKTVIDSVKKYERSNGSVWVAA